MMLHFENIGISALAACVPSEVVINRNYATDVWSQEEADKVIAKTGVERRRFAPDGMCSSDLCAKAAEKLFSDNGTDPESIDLLVFVSQTPDYRMPATSKLLQDRLGIGTSALSFDINLGCSGFVEALCVIYSMMQSGRFRRALLLDGETRSKVYNRKDRHTAFLFGDAAAAALIERDERYGESVFSVHSDGSQAGLVCIPGGGYRKPSSPETLEEKADAHGNVRSAENGCMNGADVFSFVLENVPSDVRALLKEAGGLEPDACVLHQASGFINAHLENKLKFPREKTPRCLEEFGNTSSASIPLTIVSRLKDRMDGERRLLLCAFGAGMAWASAIVPFVGCRISELQEL